MMDYMGPPQDVGYNGSRGYGHKDQGFLSKLFGGGSRPRNDWGGGPPMGMNMGYDAGYPMPRDYGMRDYPPMGYEDRSRARDFSPGRAWMASRGMDRDIDDFDDLADLLPPRRRDHLDDLDLMLSRRDPHMDMMMHGRPPLRSEPDRGRRQYRGRSPRRPMSADGRIQEENANLGWVNNNSSNNRIKVKTEVKDDMPKYKFNSPEHLHHVKYKHDSYEVDKNKNRREQLQEQLDAFHARYDERDRYDDRGRYDDRRGDRYDDRRDDRRRGGRERDDRGRDDRGRDGGRERRSRRRDDEYQSSEYDDENPYHQLPAHIPKDDYDNALKRNLHAWTQWRTGLNDRGARDPRMDSLRNRIAHQRDPDDHGFRLNDPAVLMNYGSNNQTGSPLTDEAYFKYGLPRVKGEGVEDVRRLYDGRRY